MNRYFLATFAVVLVLCPALGAERDACSIIDALIQEQSIPAEPLFQRTEIEPAQLSAREKRAAGARFDPEKRQYNRRAWMGVIWGAAAAASSAFAAPAPENLTVQAVQDWAGRLTDPDVKTQTQAVNDLRKLGDMQMLQVIQGLTRQGLGDPDHGRRVRTRKLLLQLAASTLTRKRYGDEISAALQWAYDGNSSQENETSVLIADGSLAVMLRLNVAWARVQMRYTWFSYTLDEIDFVNHIFTFAYASYNFLSAATESLESLQTEARHFLSAHTLAAILRGPHRHFRTAIYELARLVLAPPEARMTQKRFLQLMNDILEQVDAEFPSLPEMRAWPPPIIAGNKASARTHDLSRAG